MGKVAADGSISKTLVGREVAWMFDAINGHPKGGLELELAEAQTATPWSHQDLDAKCTPCSSPRIWEAWLKRHFRKEKTRMELRMKVRWKTQD